MAPSPTAPIGAARPSWPTTAVSTAPRIGIVAFETTIGSAMFSTRRWLIALTLIGAAAGIAGSGPSSGPARAAPSRMFAQCCPTCTPPTRKPDTATFLQRDKCPTRDLPFTRMRRR